MGDHRACRLYGKKIPLAPHVQKEMASTGTVMNQLITEGNDAGRVADVVSARRLVVRFLVGIPVDRA
jgi:hypothetical protein